MFTRARLAAPSDGRLLEREPSRRQCPPDALLRRVALAGLGLEPLVLLPVAAGLLVSTADLLLLRRGERAARSRGGGRRGRLALHDAQLAGLGISLQESKRCRSPRCRWKSGARSRRVKAACGSSRTTRLSAWSPSAAFRKRSLEPPNVTSAPSSVDSRSPGRAASSTAWASAPGATVSRSTSTSAEDNVGGWLRAPPSSRSGSARRSAASRPCPSYRVMRLHGPAPEGLEVPQRLPGVVALEVLPVVLVGQEQLAAVLVVAVHHLDDRLAEVGQLLRAACSSPCGTRGRGSPTSSACR